MTKDVIDADAAKLAGLQIDLLNKFRAGHSVLEALEVTLLLSDSNRLMLVSLYEEESLGELLRAMKNKHMKLVIQDIVSTGKPTVELTEKEWISRDAVVAELDMCEVLKHYHIEPGDGQRFRVHCPFHDDDRSSCSINPGAKVFNCFACGEQGNVLDFIASMEDLDPKAELRTVLKNAIQIIGYNPTFQKA